MEAERSLALATSLRKSRSEEEGSEDISMKSAEGLFGGVDDALGLSTLERSVYPLDSVDICKDKCNPSEEKWYKSCRFCY